MISAPILKRTGKLACYQEAADRGQGWRKDEDEEKKTQKLQPGVHCRGFQISCYSTAKQLCPNRLTWGSVEGRAVPLPQIPAG